MRNQFTFDVFLSHNAQDKPRVRQLAERLKQAGLRVWFDEWNVRSGDIIALKVDEGLEQSRVLLLCISPNALASGWVALERSTAIHRDPSNEGRRFIPLLLANCELPDTLRRYKYVDFREEAQTAFEEILNVCRPVKIRRRLKRRQNKIPSQLADKHRRVVILEQKLPAHSAAVNCLAFSADGSLMASASFDNSVRVWVAGSWKVLFHFTEPTGIITAISFSSDGKQLVASSKDTYIYIWDLESGRLEKKLRGHKSSVNGVVVLPGDRRLISWSGGGENAVMVWDREAEDVNVLVSQHRSGVRCLAISNCRGYGLLGFGD
jgi:hypothetical protein